MQVNILSASMLQKVDEIRSLLLKHIGNTLTNEEQAFLDQWAAAAPENAALLAEVSSEEARNAAVAEYHSLIARAQEVRKNTDIKRLARRYGRKRTWSFYLAAAASTLLIICLLWIYFLPPSPNSNHTHQQHAATKDLPPPGDKAILTLSNGKQVIISDSVNCILAEEAQSIISTSNGQVEYRKDGNINSTKNELTYNTISTPRGGKYHIVLDGLTHVYLNAASELYFPVTFSSKERRVRVKGEAYFEVSKDASRPFIVETDFGTIQVLGTKFNINQYKDEPVTKTSLLEGSIRINIGNQTKMIAPGQRAIVIKHSNNIDIAEANVKSSVAWLKGYFKFNRANFGEVMRELSRQYDVDVEYAKNIAPEKHHFQGGFERTLTLLQILEQLSKMNPSMQYELNGKKLIIRAL